MEKLHFISGLPRSGSTLLAAILRQNPRFHAGMSSPVANLYASVERAASAGNEGAVFISDAQRVAVLRGVFDSFYATSRPVVFDTNRFWTTKLPALTTLFPAAKMVCCVRDLAWIIDSFEQLFRRNPFEPSGIYNFETGTVYSRCGHLQQGNGVVGFALNGLKEALAGDQSDRILLVEYDDLCQHPEREIDRVYGFVGEEPFRHDFENVEYEAGEFDRGIGARGLHDVKGSVRWAPRKTVLPPDIFARYSEDQFWRRE